MFADEIYKKATQLKKKYKSDDPFKIAEASGIMIIENNDFKELKGLYTIIENKRVIIINANLPRENQRLVCAHELGHDVIHREFAKNRIFHEFTLYDMAARAEYEANMFAADIIILDDDINDLVFNYGYDMEQIAKKLNTDINLVGIKLANMNYRGYQFKIGIPPKNNFL